MPFLPHLLALAALVAVSAASPAALSPILGRAATAGHHCANPKVAHNATIHVNGKAVTLTSFQCAPATAVARRDLWTSFPLCILLGTCAPEPAPAPLPPQNVCGVTCTTTCNTLAGTLPPISQDCQQIEDAIQIFQSETTTFVVDPNQLETLTFQTCSYFFQNNGFQQLEYCWADLSTTASRAGSACFPPVQPLSSEGLCTSSDLTWAVGAAHS